VPVQKSEPTRKGLSQRRPATDGDEGAGKDRSGGVAFRPRVLCHAPNRAEAWNDTRSFAAEGVTATSVAHAGWVVASPGHNDRQH